MSDMTIQIKGRNWKFILMNDRRFDKLHNPTGESPAVAMTIPDIYEAHFRKSDWDIVTIRHELGHILYLMSLTGSAELSAHQVEETFAEIIGHHSAEIVVWAETVAERFFKE